MKFLHSDLGEKIMIIVGLIVACALLFFCFAVAWQNGDTQTFLKKCNGEAVVEDVVQEPVEKPVEEPEELPLDPNKPMIALTFDDGPSIYTDELLTILQENSVRASFFVLGERVDRYPETITRMEELECEIGNHTYYHTKLTEVDFEYAQLEIEWTNDSLKRVLGYGASLVRPPYGAVNEMIRTSASYPFAMWSVDTTDWQLKDAAAVAQYILDTAKDGDVILLHDIYSTTIEAMRIVIPELKARGYQIVTFSEMMEVHGTKMEVGQKYFNCY